MSKGCSNVIGLNLVLVDLGGGSADVSNLAMGKEDVK
jgi:hypothetical protein